MSQDPNGPKYVGIDPPDSPDAVVKKYQEDTAKRREARKAAKKAMNPPIPNLQRAAGQYDHTKDGPMTLSQIAQAQKKVDTLTGGGGGGTAKGGLRPETLAGLQALHDQTQKERKHMSESTPPSEETPKEKPPEPKPKLKDDDEVRDTVAAMDDMDLELLMERVRSDIINNDKERKSIEKRLKAIDLAEGLSTGEFRQVVPIKPDVFEVTFRTVSQMENDEFRRILFNWNSEDPRATNLSSERYGLMQTVASVVQISGNKLPNHLRDAGNGIKEFDQDIFLKKYRLVASYPTPLIHALGTHAFWFDQRVRKLFTSESLKNG